MGLELTILSLKIDIAFHPIVDTIAVNRGPADMLESAQNSVWVVSKGCSGD